MGRNGSGKSTLLAALLGTVPLAGGRRLLGRGVVVGELDQRRLRFAGDEPLARAFAAEAGCRLEEARTLLAKFGLGADDVERPGATLSPGERTRAELALLAARGVNLLVLDEPTNHLDLPAIEELEAALEGYSGTVVLVTHDRRLLERFSATRELRPRRRRARRRAEPHGEACSRRSPRGRHRRRRPTRVPAPGGNAPGGAAPIAPECAASAPKPA